MARSLVQFHIKMDLHSNFATKHLHRMVSSLPKQRSAPKSGRSFEHFLKEEDPEDVIRQAL